jgi:hypothetical protein
MIMNAITLLVGAGIFLLGLGTGTLTTILFRNPSASTPQAICSCSHGLGQHNEAHGKCHGQILRKNMRNPRGAWIGDQWVDCTCRHYDGPQPIEQYLATPTLPPRDGG